MRFNKLFITLLICIIFIVTKPLLQKGFIPTHDGEYHIIRFYEFYSMIASGFLFPRWAPHLNSGYGLPLFLFHYPLPNYLGSLFHMLGFSFISSFKLSLASVYGISVILSYVWLRKIFSDSSALAGAIAFAFTPYMFVDMYVRGSIGELLAILFVMMTLISIEYGKSRLISLSYAGLILSHNISVIIFTPLIISYICIKNKHVLLYMVFGVMLASYFWLPAIVESSYVVGLNSVTYKDHFPLLIQLLIPSWGTGFSVPGFSYDEPSFQIGIINLIACIVYLIFFLVNKETFKKYGILFLSIICFYTFMMLSISLKVWESVPFMQFIQYPWRLLAIVPICCSFFVASLFYRLKKLVLGVLLVLTLISLMISSQYFHPVIYDERVDSYYLNNSNFIDGTSSLGNSFSTIWTPWKPFKPPNKAEFITGNGKITVKTINPIYFNFNAISNVRSMIQFNKIYFPGWKVVLEGKEIPINYISNGTIQFYIPKGRSSGSVFFTESNIRIIADLISLVSLCMLLSFEKIIGKRKI